LAGTGERRVRRIEWKVAEERSILVLLDELQRVIGEIVGDEPFASNRLPVMIERRIKVFTPMPEVKP
jgi:hypothetical protein